MIDSQGSKFGAGRRARRLFSVSTLAGLSLTLFACAQTPSRDAAAPAAPVAEVTRTAPETATEPRAGISGDALYKLLVAEFAGRRGNLDLAIRDYLDVARTTRDPAVAERAVRIAVYARDPVQGRAAAHLWTELAPDNAKAREVYASLLIRAGLIPGAVAQLKILVEKQRDQQPQTLRRIGDMLAREKDRGAALKVMAALVADYPESAAALISYGRLLALASRFDEAAAAVGKALALAPDDQRAVALLARVRQRQGRTADALATLSKFLEQSPAADSVRITYARLLVDAKRFDQARAQFERLVKGAPDNDDVRYALALLLLQTSHLDQAKAHFEHLAAGLKRRYAAYYYLGQIAELKGDHAAALKAYGKVDRGQHALDARIRAALLMAKDGEIDAARASLRDYPTRTTVEAVRVYRAEAELLMRNDRSADAMAVYNAALDEFPQNSDLLYARAMLAEKMGKPELLERDLRSILAREPDNAEALNALGYTLADRRQRLDEAYKLITRALELKPDDRFIVDSMGWILYRMGRNQEALKYLRRALELNDDPEISAHLGEVLWVTGDHQQARKVWETALKRTPDHKALREVIKRFSE